MPQDHRTRLDEWRKQHMPASRIGARVDAEEKARQIVAQHLGALSAGDVLGAFDQLNVDGTPGAGIRFGLLLAQPNYNKMIAELGVLNEWISRLWNAEESAAPALVDEFEKLRPLKGATGQFASIVLYLRKPDRFAPWVRPLDRAVQIERGDTSLGFQTYAEFNAAAREMRLRYALHPQELDAISPEAFVGKPADAWWVNQGDTYQAAKALGSIWAPAKNQNGQTFFFWDNVSKVKRGDLVFHYAAGSLRAVSKAASDGFSSEKVIGGGKWPSGGWRVDMEYHEFARPVPIAEIGPVIAKLKLTKGPISSNGKANQGYLFKLSSEAVERICAAVGNDRALTAVGLPPDPRPWLLGVARTDFTGHAGEAGLCMDETLVTRFLASLLARRFLLLTGLSGSGKTKLAQALAQWMDAGAAAAGGAAGDAAAAERPEKGQRLEDGFVWRVEPYHLDQERVMFSREFTDEPFKTPDALAPEDILVLLDGKTEVKARLRRTSNSSPQIYSLKGIMAWLGNLGVGSFFRVRFLEPRTGFRNVLSFERLDAPPQRDPCYALVAVGANWTSKEDLLGYPDALTPGVFRAKPALELLLRAAQDEARAYFLILDEMNLSHVERYFSDFLSAMESGEAIALHDDDERQTESGTPVPASLRVPENLFVIGTVNVDETTYLFSPKVLDRANVIEFRADADAVSGFLSSPVEVDLDRLAGRGAEYAGAFVEAAGQRLGAEVDLDAAVKNKLKAELEVLFAVLADHEAEFGFRTAKDIARFVHFFLRLQGDGDAAADADGLFALAMDAVVMQKILPRMHGSKRKLGPVLRGLGELCAAEPAPAAGASLSRPDRARLAAAGKPAEGSPFLQTLDDLLRACRTASSTPSAPALRYPMSFEKIVRMLRKLDRDGFASFAEA